MNTNHTNVADDPNDYQAKQRAVIQQGWNDVNQLNNQQSVDQFTKQPTYTPEERKIFQECQKDSAYRAVPMSLFSMLACSIGIKRGIIPNRSPLMKTAGAAFLGYALGKISYFRSGQCQEKFLRELPHSNTAFQIRKSRGLPEPELSDNVETAHLEDMASETSLIFNPEETGTSHEAMPSNTMTYEKLRENNRNMDRFRKVQTEGTYPNLIKEPPPSPPSYSLSAPAEDVPKRVRINQYGDEVYE